MKRNKSLGLTVYWQVVALWQNYKSSPELDQLGTITKDAVKDWRDILLALRVKLDKKYGKSLVAGGSGNWMRDAGKKIVWLKEKEDILDLRRKLGSASDTITMLTLAAMGFVIILYYLRRVLTCG
jgi:hypothetical protein